MNFGEEFPIRHEDQCGLLVIDADDQSSISWRDFFPNKVAIGIKGQRLSLVARPPFEFDQRAGTDAHMNNYHKTLSLHGCSAQIPNNFNTLDQCAIDEMVSGSIDRALCIIAAGVNVDSSVTFVTLEGDVVVFDPADNCIPPGDYVPTSNGTQVFLPNEEGRWPEGIPGFAVESQWLLSRSKSALEDTSLSIDNSYLNDADTAAETDDT